MLNPTVRSPSSSSSASTSSMSASESASRSWVKLDSSLMRSSSISRISASRSRRIRYTSSGPMGPCATCVSAGIDGFLEPPPHAGLDASLRDPNRVNDRARRRRAVRDDAHTVDTEQHRAAGQIGIEHGRRLEQQRSDDLARLLRLGRRVEHAEDELDGGAQRPLERLEHDVAREPVGHDDVDRSVHEVATLDVATEAGHLLEQGERALAQLVALSGLLAVREETDRGLVHREAGTGVLTAPTRELGGPFRRANTARPAA